MRSVIGGRGGIRTHGALAGTPVFKTGALNHSATLPALWKPALSKAEGVAKEAIAPKSRCLIDHLSLARTAPYTCKQKPGRNPAVHGFLGMLLHPEIAGGTWIARTRGGDKLRKINLWFTTPCIGSFPAWKQWVKVIAV